MMLTVAIFLFVDCTYVFLMYRL